MTHPLSLTFVLMEVTLFSRILDLPSIMRLNKASANFFSRSLMFLHTYLHSQLYSSYVVEFQTKQKPIVAQNPLVQTTTSVLETPGLSDQWVGCTNLFGVRVTDLETGSSVQIFNGQEKEDQKKSVTTSLPFLPSSIFPCDEDLFGFVDPCVESTNNIFFYRIQNDFQLTQVASFQLPTTVGFQSNESTVVSSFQHFFSRSEPTICFQDVTGETRVFDLITETQLHHFQDMLMPFMKNGSLLSGAAWDRWLGTIDLREKYKGIQASSVGKNLHLHGNFLLINPDGTVIVCEQKEARFLPRGTLSIHEAPPYVSSSDVYYASIYGGNYSLWYDNRYSFTPLKGECMMKVRTMAYEEPQVYKWNRYAKFCFAGNQRVCLVENVNEWRSI
jgi:hypothetical protein